MLLVAALNLLSNSLLYSDISLCLFAVSLHSDINKSYSVCITSSIIGISFAMLLIISISNV